MMIEWSSDKVSVTISKLSVYFSHIICCFHLHCAELCLTNANVNAPLTHFFGFYKVTVAVKARPVISRFDISRTYTPTSREHLRTKVTLDFHLTFGTNGGNLGSESK